MTARGRRPRSSAPSFVVGADGANGVVARAIGLGDGIVRGVALEGNVPWGALERAPYDGTAWVELGVVAGGYGWVFPKGDHANLGVGGWLEEGPAAPRPPRPRWLAPTASTRRRSRTFEGTGSRCACSAHRRHVVASCSSATRPASSTRSRETGSTRPSSRPSSRPRRSSPVDPRSTRLRSPPRSTRHAASSWKAKRAADRYPRACLWALRAPGVFGVVAGLLRGDLAHPSEARRLARPPLRVLSRLARRASRAVGSDPWGLTPKDAFRLVPMHELSMDLSAVLRHAVRAGASDVHLKVGQPPVLRTDGELTPAVDFGPLGDVELEAVLAQVTAAVPQRRERFLETGDLDLAYSEPGLPRFRINGFRQRGAISFAFRVIPDEIPSFDELHLPPGVARLANEQRGLVLVTGATGSGKTTTLAAMLDEINRTRRQHIVTIEDPIEILHPDRSCIVNQREVGLDTESFEQALRRVLRQDPDVILIGELRDAETAQVALQAAESGHLVFSTLHTLDAAETIGRLVEFFPPEKQPQVVSIIAGVLRGVISQRLLPRLDGGRIPAVEVMVSNARIAELIRERRADEISDAIDDGEFFEMQTFSKALIGLVLDGLVDRETAANAATNRHDFEIALDRAEKIVQSKAKAAAEAEGDGAIRRSGSRASEGRRAPRAARRR